MKLNQEYVLQMALLTFRVSDANRISDGCNQNLILNEIIKFQMPIH